MLRNGDGESKAAAASGGTLNAGDGAALDSQEKVDGCIYPDEVIMENGVVFNVRYTGCIEVKTSMKSLDFLSRTQVARECINRVCEAAGLISLSKRRLDKKIAQYIADRPCMQNAGTNVIINVSSRALNLINVDTGEVIACHQMPRISFASGGDSDTLDFLAYIAKNEDEWRACYVLECIGGQSEDLIVTIGKAFMLRYNALNRKGQHQQQQQQQQQQHRLQHHHHHQRTGQSSKSSENFSEDAASLLKENDKEYYNDLPNKLPPDLLGTNDGVHEQQQHHSSNQFKVAQLNLKKGRDHRLSSNLIDLNSPPPEQTTNRINMNSFEVLNEGCSIGAAAAMTLPGPVAVTNTLLSATTAASTVATATTASTAIAMNAQSTAEAGRPRDVFDTPPFSLSAEVQRSQLITESWFHGVISRPVAESLLTAEGDFLVRESQGKHGQYVLTGLAAKMPKHLLLIDPEGVVRTKDRIFESISHLINYHWTNVLPIISEDSELILRNPINSNRLNTVGNNNNNNNNNNNSTSSGNHATEQQAGACGASRTGTQNKE